jgi:hypothetical protein
MTPRKQRQPFVRRVIPADVWDYWEIVGEQYGGFSLYHGPGLIDAEDLAGSPEDLWTGDDRKEVLCARVDAGIFLDDESRAVYAINRRRRRQLTARVSFLALMQELGCVRGDV